jgi:hypothetical protein
MPLAPPYRPSFCRWNEDGEGSCEGNGLSGETSIVREQTSQEQAAEEEEEDEKAKLFCKAANPRKALAKKIRQVGKVGTTLSSKSLKELESMQPQELKKTENEYPELAEWYGAFDLYVGLPPFMSNPVCIKKDYNIPTWKLGDFDKWEDPCQRPPYFSSRGYNFASATGSLSAGDFSLTGVACSDGYHGTSTPEVTACASPEEEYTIRGCEWTNICRCQDGTPKLVESSCSTPDAPDQCASCDEGFHLVGSSCRENTYECPGGTGSSGRYCREVGPVSGLDHKCPLSHGSRCLLGRDVPLLRPIIGLGGMNNI